MTSAISTTPQSQIQAALAKINGNRQKRTVEIKSVLPLIERALLGQTPAPITHKVANSYGYSSVGTYCRVAKKSTGEIVIPVWLDSTNRAGQFPGVTARKDDRVQEQVDALKPFDGGTRHTFVLTPFEAASTVTSDQVSQNLLVAIATESDPVAMAAYRDRKIEMQG
jgi:hypothetical protein